MNSISKVQIILVPSETSHLRFWMSWVSKYPRKWTAKVESSTKLLDYILVDQIPDPNANDYIFTPIPNVVNEIKLTMMKSFLLSNDMFLPFRHIRHTSRLRMFPPIVLAFLNTLNLGAFNLGRFLDRLR